MFHIFQIIPNVIIFWLFIYVFPLSAFSVKKLTLKHSKFIRYFSRTMQLPIFIKVSYNSTNCFSIRTFMIAFKMIRFKYSLVITSVSNYISPESLSFTLFKRTLEKSTIVIDFPTAFRFSILIYKSIILSTVHDKLYHFILIWMDFLSFLVFNRNI